MNIKELDPNFPDTNKRKYITYDILSVISAFFAIAFEIVGILFLIASIGNEVSFWLAVSFMVLGGLLFYSFSSLADKRNNEHVNVELVETFKLYKGRVKEYLLTNKALNKTEYVCVVYNEESNEQGYHEFKEIKKIINKRKMYPNDTIFK